MADETSSTRGDAERRRPAAGGISLGEEAGDDLPALLTLAVGIAVIVVLLAGSGAWPRSESGSAGTAAAPGISAADEVGDNEGDTSGSAGDAGGGDSDGGDSDGAAGGGDTGGEVAAPGAEIDDDVVAALATTWPGLVFEHAGGVLTVSGQVDSDDAKTELLAAAAALPGVSEVIDQVEVLPTATGAVAVEAAQGGIVLEGVVPEEAFAEALVARVADIYAPDQIDDRLVVDGSVGPPVGITITGTTTDDVLHREVVAAFTGISGVDPVDVAGFALAESTELESSLNTLEPIQFASGSARIVVASEPALDQAAALLAADPSIRLEVGGHTDSVGEPEGNQRLSQSRADAVVTALRDRGVTNDLVARGFGETRLKVDPDDTEEKRQENRRIEFRILG